MRQRFRNVDELNKVIKKNDVAVARGRRVEQTRMLAIEMEKTIFYMSHDKVC